MSDDARTTAARVAARIAGAPPRAIEPLGGGLSNQVFAVHTARGALVVRLGEGEGRAAAFARGRRSTELARRAGVPTAPVLDVGLDGRWAYSVAERLDGQPASQHADRPRLLEALGRLATRVHSIRTSGHGRDFAPSGELPPTERSWANFLYDEIDADARLRRLRDAAVITSAQHDALAATLGTVARWDAPPVLQHGDLRLKNVVVNPGGEIVGLIDWDDALSSIGSHWDLSVALHDLAIDEKQAFLAGYGLPEADVRRAAPAWRLFNALNYAPELDRLLAAADHASVERLCTRLSGALDLYGTSD